MLFDSHAHMTDEAFDGDREEILSGLKEKGVGTLLNPGCSLRDSERAVALANRFDFVYAAVGTHPDVAGEADGAVIGRYRQMIAENPKVRAVGEIGLDYHYETVPRQIQQRAFRMQMELARETGLPVIIHERDAHEDGMRIVREFPEVTGVFHCYSGSPEMARQLVDMGYFIGFTGVLTFKNARKAVQCAKDLPIERIVLETDCPYMAPEPFRGRRNDPGYLYCMAQRLAQLRDMTTEAVCRITDENARRLFRI